MIMILVVLLESGDMSTIRFSGRKSCEQARQILIKDEQIKTTYCLEW